jgi:hypothetical protein
MSSLADNDIDQPSASTHSFRFGSGEVVRLNEQQIDRIPYLAGLVSSADWFVGARDAEGHFKLDPTIEFEYFSDVLEVSLCCSLQELVAYLPLKRDIIPVITHLDFLGLIDQATPTLDEVDDTFFCTLVYQIHVGNFTERIQPCSFQTMAARFAIALVKEDYDFTDDQVMDRIYWYVLFILSAHSVFNAYFRHNVYRIATLCFGLFKPSLLKSLEKLRMDIKTEQETNQLLSSTSGDDTSDNEVSDRVLEHLIDRYPRRILIRPFLMGKSIMMSWSSSDYIHDESPNNYYRLSEDSYLDTLPCFTEGL